MTRSLRSAGRSAAARAWGVAVYLGDLTPPGVRYGYLHPMVARLASEPTKSLSEVPGIYFAPGLPPVTAHDHGVTCVLAADSLDVGGVGRVVEMLALGLAAFGVRPVVVCPDEGDRTARLRLREIDVEVADTPAKMRAAIVRARPDVVQLHSAPAALVDELAEDRELVLVPVLHNTEIHYDTAMWIRTRKLFSRSAHVVAVSDVVRRFHLRHLPDTPVEISVIANGAMPISPHPPEARTRARRALEEVIGSRLDDVTVFCSLARYDSQKNVAGLVSAFLDADADAALVVAGDTSDWLEYRRARAIKDAHPRGHRVHLLGRSDPSALLAASDAFILDSFFEGWPLATTEAVAVGLPIVVSDTGGARELVARAPRGSTVIANPTGPADAVTDGRVRRARRQAGGQRNSAELASAVQRVAAAGPNGLVEVERTDASYLEMVSAHAALIRGMSADGVGVPPPEAEPT